MPGLRGFMYNVWAKILSSMPGMMKDPSYNTPDSKPSPSTLPILFCPIGPPVTKSSLVVVIIFRNVQVRVGA